jgi:hypothetical protein
LRKSSITACSREWGDEPWGDDKEEEEEEGKISEKL